MNIRPALLAAVFPLLAACSSAPTTVPRPMDVPPPPPPDEPPAAGAVDAPNRIPEEAMPAAEGSFRWPARGPIAERRGTAGLGIRTSGDVVAAKSGVVRLTLSSWQGRRNLVALRHADGYVTLVADVDEILVPIGKAVRQGETIARLKTPGVLQFWLYREKQALDPALHLP
jgi:murein DD-endopeptidase MepM/ murein hydrolase activator NlpD